MKASSVLQLENQWYHRLYLTRFDDSLLQKDVTDSLKYALHQAAICRLPDDLDLSVLTVLSCHSLYHWEPVSRRQLRCTVGMVEHNRQVTLCIGCCCCYRC